MKIFNAFVILSIVMLLVACDGINELNSPDSSSSDIPAWKAAIERQNLTFLKMPKIEESSLNKSVTEMAYADKNNKIRFQYIYREQNRFSFAVWMNLNIGAGALDEDTEITISIDEEHFVTDLSAKFYPGGTSFNYPAELDLLSIGLELGTADELKNLQFAYFNESSGDWEVMPVRRLFATASGLLICKDAEIPHFSRFGFIR